MSSSVNRPGYWVISDANLRAMLLRVADGEDPDLVMTEEYANCEIRDVPPMGTEGAPS